MATVPRLEVPSIAKTQKPDPTCLFLNSYYLPHSRTIEAVPYYTRRKQQLTTQPQPTHPSDPSLTSERIKQQIAQAVGNQRGINPLLAPHLRTLRVEPVVADNCFSNFSEEQYPITDHEKLRVCEERYFPLQNYYNYVYELEHQKGISRVAEVAEQIMPKATGLHQQSESSYSPVPAPTVNSSPQDLQISRVKGFYSTQFQPRGNRTAEMSEKSEEQLARHLGWNEDRRKVVFVPKEGRRLELSRSDNRRY